MLLLIIGIAIITIPLVMDAKKSAPIVKYSMKPYSTIKPLPPTKDTYISRDRQLGQLGYLEERDFVFYIDKIIGWATAIVGLWIIITNRKSRRKSV